MEPEILLSISIRLPLADRVALSEHLATLMKEAVKIGGITTNISMQPYDPDEEPD
jgi:hypothetical protein